jgi:hypothetical protein
MIAVPCRSRDRLRGVLTAVRLGEADPFGAGHTAMLERQADALAALLAAVLASRITCSPTEEADSPGYLSEFPLETPTNLLIP